MKMYIFNELLMKFVNFSWFQTGYYSHMFCVLKPGNKWQISDAYYHIDIYRCSFWWIFWLKKFYALSSGYPESVWGSWEAVWVNALPMGLPVFIIHLYIVLHVIVQCTTDQIYITTVQETGHTGENNIFIYI